MAGMLTQAAALALVALGAAACDRGPSTSSEYNNSGASVAVGLPGSATSSAPPQPVNPPPNIRAAEIPHDMTPPAPPAAPAQADAGTAPGTQNATSPQGAAPADAGNRQAAH